MRSTYGLSEIGDRGDDVAAENLKRRDLIHVRNDAYYGLDAHVGKPAQLPDQLACFRAILADVEGERACLLYLVVVSSLRIAVLAQHTKLSWDFGAGA